MNGIAAPAICVIIPSKLGQSRNVKHLTHWILPHMSLIPPIVKGDSADTIIGEIGPLNLRNHHMKTLPHTVFGDGKLTSPNLPVSLHS